MSDVLVRVEGVSKKFCKTLNRSMLYGIQDVTKNMLGIEPDTNRLRPGEFWSVDDVSFEVRRGECLGLIGPNGAGKSTLLKLLNGIISPDKGRIEINGRIGALIEVTAGFHPMLTGRENIYINGSILGFSRKEVEKKFDEIVEFSGLGDFIDTPVKHYSTGMNVRLGFAIAAQMEPDVLLIDEVLAVGDVGFTVKCFNAIAKIIKHAAVILVSHNLPQVARICSDVCVMNKGSVDFQGKDVSNGINHYFSMFESQNGIISGNGKAKIYKIMIESKSKKDVSQICFGDDISINLELMISLEIKYPIIIISFSNLEMQIVAQINSLYGKVPIYNSGEKMNIKVNLDSFQLNPGGYFLSVVVFDETKQHILAHHYTVKKINVTGEFIGLAPVQFIGHWDFNDKLLYKETTVTGNKGKIQG
ncbi:MAG: ABC transporter ATP-binding protein [Nitrospirae bacterium]|nr:ABC transporter ATP-binding protein [Nitrospirota bacterium]